MDIPYNVKPRPDTGLYNAKVGIWLFLASEVMLFGAFFSAYILLRVGNTFWPHGLLDVPIGTANTIVLIGSSMTVIMAWASLKMGKFNHFKIYQGLTVLCAFTFLVVKGFEYKAKFVHYEVWLQDGTSKTGHIEGNPMFLNLQKMESRKMDHIMFSEDPPKDHAATGEVKKVAAAGTDHQADVGHDAKGAGDHHAAVKIEASEIKRLSAYVPSHGPYFAIYFTMTALHGLHVLGGALVMLYFWGPGSRMWKTDPERFTNRIEVSGLFWHFVDLVWIFLFPVLYLL